MRRRNRRTAATAGKKRRVSPSRGWSFLLQFGQDGVREPTPVLPVLGEGRVRLGVCLPLTARRDTGKAENMPVLQGWSWQMRKGRSSDHRDWKGLRLVVTDGRPTDRPDPRATSRAAEEDRSTGGVARLAPNAQANIGSLLRAMYDSALHEPVPERFLDLLRQMEAKGEAGEEQPGQGRESRQPKTE